MLANEVHLCARRVPVCEGLAVQRERLHVAQDAHAGLARVVVTIVELGWGEELPSREGVGVARVPE